MQAHYVCSQSSLSMIEGMRINSGLVCLFGKLLGGCLEIEKREFGLIVVTILFRIVVESCRECQGWEKSNREIWEFKEN